MSVVSQQTVVQETEQLIFDCNYQVVGIINLNKMCTTVQFHRNCPTSP